MKLTRCEYLYVGDDGTLRVPIGRSGMLLTIDGGQHLVTMDSCRFIGWGYGLVSIPSIPNLPAIYFPPSERMGLAGRWLEGFTADPLVVAYARDFWLDVMLMGRAPADDPSFAPGMIPLLDELA